MDRVLHAGRFFFASAMMFFGMQHLWYGRFTGGLPPIPPGPASSAWTYLAGLLLLVAGVSVVLNFRARLSATLLGVLFVSSFFVLQLPALAMNWHSGSQWTRAFEALALGGAGLGLAGEFPAATTDSRGWDSAVENASRTGRILFGAPLFVFGVQHFLYAAYVATLVPSWIPWHLFWTYVAGVAFLSAGLAITTGIMASLAATMLGTMFFLWVVLLHGPRIARTLYNGDEWTSGFVALAMSGGSLLVALRERKNRIRDVLGSKT